MLIWAKKSEVDVEVISSIQKLYNKRKKLDNLKDILKGWELSVIYRQIKRHFGERKDISILDFGAGASPFGAYLNHKGYENVICIDKKKGWYQKINQESYNRIYESAVTYAQFDIVSNHIGKYDVIYSASVIEHIAEEERLTVMQALVMDLATGGLFIHVVDYYCGYKGINFKKLIDNCDIPILYKPKDTPGCKGFSGPPRHTWWDIRKKMKMITRIAFFNEREA